MSSKQGHVPQPYQWKFTGYRHSDIALTISVPLLDIILPVWPLTEQTRPWLIARVCWGTGTLLGRTHSQPIGPANARVNVDTFYPGNPPTQPHLSLLKLAYLARTLLTSGQRSSGTKYTEYGNTDTTCRSWVSLLEATPDALPATYPDPTRRCIPMITEGSGCTIGGRQPVCRYI